MDTGRWDTLVAQHATAHYKFRVFLDLQPVIMFFQGLVNHHRPTSFRAVRLKG